MRVALRKAQSHSRKSKEHYDRFAGQYDKYYGEYLQAFRSLNSDEHMESCAARCGLADGQHILDAGCGHAGPAIWIAKRFPNSRIDCLTISPVQADFAKQKIAQAGLSGRISVHVGNFDCLRYLFRQNTFDRVLFLEAFSYTRSPRALFDEIDFVLKHGGFIYLKEFIEHLRRYHTPWIFKRDLALTFKHYHYKVRSLPKLLIDLGKTNLELVSINVVPPDETETYVYVTVPFELETGCLTHQAWRPDSGTVYEIVSKKP
jgi:cyclopropane fatty-acyl-phospholipid synthase-like methyltransferase